MSFNIDSAPQITKCAYKIKCNNNSLRTCIDKVIQNTLIIIFGVLKLKLVVQLQKSQESDAFKVPTFSTTNHNLLQFPTVYFIDMSYLPVLRCVWRLGLANPIVRWEGRWLCPSCTHHRWYCIDTGALAQKWIHKSLTWTSSTGARPWLEDNHRCPTEGRSQHSIQLWNAPTISCCRHKVCCAW